MKTVIRMNDDRFPNELLFDQRNMSDQVMPVSKIIVAFNFPNIHIDLAKICAALYFSIPAFVPIVGIENHISPAVKNPHFIFCRINSNSLREEIIIDSISVRRKCIRNKYGDIRINTNAVNRSVDTAVACCNSEFNIETTRTAI